MSLGNQISHSMNANLSISGDKVQGASNRGPSGHPLLKRVMVCSLSLVTLWMTGCSKEEKPAEPQNTATEVKSGPKVPETPPEALVLGVREKDGSLRTLFVTDGKIEALGKGLAVPRADGWWTVDLVKQVDASGKFQDVQLVSGKAGSKLTPEPLQAMEGCKQDMTVTTLFVGTTHASYEAESVAICDGSSTPNQSHEIGVYSLDDLKPGKRMGMDVVLGENAYKQFVVDGTEAQGKMKNGACMDGPGTPGWGLIRKNGQWALRGGMSYVGDSCRGLFEAYDVHFIPDPKLVGHDALMRSLDAIRGSSKDQILDVVAGPGSHMEVLVTANELILNHDSMEKARFSAPGVAIVMAQWAVGADNVKRWREDAAKAVVKP